MKKLPKDIQLNESLLRALDDPEKEEKLRAVCTRLKALGNTKDYSADKTVPWLDLLYYGVPKSIKFSQIANVLEV